MENSPQYLFLASGVNNGEGFWFVGIKNCEENILEDENLLDCHRKELIGTESAKDILLGLIFTGMIFYIIYAVSINKESLEDKKIRNKKE